MKIQHLLAGIAGSALFATACMAATSNITSSHRTDYYASGKHQFYVWCATGNDRIAFQDGATAMDAQAKLAQSGVAAAQGGCQLTWQGRIKS